MTFTINPQRNSFFLPIYIMQEGGEGCVFIVYVIFLELKQGSGPKYSYARYVRKGPPAKKICWNRQGPPFASSAQSALVNLALKRLASTTGSKSRRGISSHDPNIGLFMINSLTDIEKEESLHFLVPEIIQHSITHVLILHSFTC